MDDQVAYVDSDRLLDFADKLSRKLSNYQKALDVLSARLSNLGRSWRDEQYQEFCREVVTTKRIIEEFIREGQAARQNLLQDAEKARAYEAINVKS